MKKSYLMFALLLIASVPLFFVNCGGPQNFLMRDGGTGTGNPIIHPPGDPVDPDLGEPGKRTPEEPVEGPEIPLLPTPSPSATPVVTPGTNPSPAIGGHLWHLATKICATQLRCSSTDRQSVSVCLTQMMESKTIAPALSAASKIKVDGSFREVLEMEATGKITIELKPLTVCENFIEGYQCSGGTNKIQTSAAIPESQLLLHLLPTDQCGLVIH